MRDPLVLPFLAVVGGIFAVHWQPFGWAELTLPCVLGLTVWYFSTRYQWVYSAGAGMTLAFMGLGGILATAAAPGKPPVIDFRHGEVLLIAGCVVEPPVFSAGREQFTLELEPQARMKVTLTHTGEAAARLEYGQWIEFPGRLRKPHNFGNPGSFDYTGYLGRRNVFWQASAAGSVQVLREDCGQSWRAALYRIRGKSLERLEQLYRGDSYRTGMMKALLLGEASGLQTVWTEHFRRTGTYHALVISGAHITALAAAFLLLFRVLRVPLVTALTITAVLAWIYAFIAGAEPPVTRSAAGFTLLLATRYFYRRVRLLNLLALVGFLFVLWDPAQVVEASFQLSFLSVAALGAFVLPLSEKTTGLFARACVGLPETERDVHMDPRVAAWRVELRLWAETVQVWLRIPTRWTLIAMAGVLRTLLFAIELAVASAVIQVALALPMIEYFHRLSITGLTANVLATPMLTLAVPIGFLAIFTGWPAPAWFAGQLLGLSQRVVDWHAAWEPNWRVPDPPFWMAVAFLAAIGCTALCIRKNSRWAWAASLATFSSLTLIVLGPVTAKEAGRWLEITAIDVGQGESLLLKLPNGSTMLIDGGGFPVFGRKIRPRMEIGEDVVSPYLWSLGIRHLDIVVMTHAHEDHSGGLSAVIRNFRPRELWTGIATDSPEWNSVAAAAKEVGTPLRLMKAGESRYLGEVRFQTLAPLVDYRPTTKPGNADSLVMRVDYGRHAVLLTGDAEIRTLAQVAQAGLLKGITVLKAAHHGSRTSNSPGLLEQVRPAVALISAGFENSYGLPHPDVLTALHKVHCLTLRTDRDGAVTVRTDGHYLEIGSPGPGSPSGFDPLSGAN